MSRGQHKKGDSMTVLSLFDGISCGRIALERAGIKDITYYASEIKKSAIRCSHENYPDIIHIGDVKKISYDDGVLYTEHGVFNVGAIDLLIGGSPCQDFSIAASRWHKEQNNKYGLMGDNSSLFYEFLRLKEEIKPRYFLLENVKMKKESEMELDNYLGCGSININSNLVSFQNRNRLYWTNIPNITIPTDKNISFQDYKDSDIIRCEESKVNKTPSRERMWNNGKSSGTHGNCKNITYSTKIGCLTRKQDRCPNSGLIEYKEFCRFLTRRELELAQTLPPGYCDSLTFRQVQDVTGDAWTVDVIAHIFKGLNV